MYRFSFLPPHLPLKPFNPPRNLILMVLDAESSWATMSPSSTQTLAWMSESSSDHQETSFSSLVDFPLVGEAQKYQGVSQHG